MLPVSLIIPVYNESGAIDDLKRRLHGVQKKLTPDSEIILVDDGSTDGSAVSLDAVVAASNGSLRLIRHATNRGYGAALKTGIEEARHPWIAIADADGTYPIGRLPELIAEIEAGARMAIGARRASDLFWLRRPPKAFLRALASYLAGRRIPDLNSGLRVFAREDARELRKLLPDGFSFTTTITMALMTAGQKVSFIPIRYKGRIGSSKIRPIRDTMNFLTLICRISMAFRPLRVFGPTGLGLLGLGVLFLVLRFLGFEIAVATTVFLLVGGMQLIGLGLLADLVNRRG
ncbi:glycosyltransferase family 2 protein [bacterium]|nr:glycosyltransferase family 2 protein [bacterium]